MYCQCTHTCHTKRGDDTLIHTNSVRHSLLANTELGVPTEPTNVGSVHCTCVRRSLLVTKTSSGQVATVGGVLSEETKTTTRVTGDHW